MAITQWTPGARFEIANDPYNVAGGALATPVKVVNTDQENALFDYTYIANDETIWDSMFVQTMVSALAARLAIAISGDRALAQLRTQEANSILLQSRVTAANEELTVLDHIPDWLRIRGVGGNQDYDYVYPYGPLFLLAP